jgi:hypothetical protein
MKTAHNIGSLYGAGVYAKVTCECCGKVFPLPCPKKDYRFQVCDRYFCGWKCKRQYEREHPKRSNIYMDYLT